jgi:hypothetical protein
MRILFINNDGGGFADYIEVAPGTTAAQLFEERLPERRPDEYLLRVNRGGTRCHACDCGSMDEDDCRLCEQCGHDYCPDCWSSCGVCGDVRCLDCMKCCAVCYEHCCGRCLHGSVHAGGECCRDCLRTCASCGAQVAKDEVSPAFDRCPGCRVPESSCVRGDQPPSPEQGPHPAPEIRSLEHEHAKTLEHLAPSTPYAAAPGHVLNRALFPFPTPSTPLKPPVQDRAASAITRP